MLKKHRVINNIIDQGIVAVIRAPTPDDALASANALVDGGIDTIEVTFTVAAAHHILEKLASSPCLLGAGTVLDAETARIAILSGASYIVAPHFNKETALLCNRYAIPYIAGCYTPAEAIAAMQYGVEIIKLFPAGLLSPKIISAFKGPLPQVNIMPTGGINLNNITPWIVGGAVAVGVGGSLVKAQDGRWHHITDQAVAYRKKIAEARASMDEV